MWREGEHECTLHSCVGERRNGWMGAQDCKFKGGGREATNRNHLSLEKQFEGAWHMLQCKTYEK